jgi:hypothetical protein
VPSVVNAAQVGMSDETLNLDERADWARCTSHPECIGIAIPDRDGKCLAHLDEDELSDALKASARTDGVGRVRGGPR